MQYITWCVVCGVCVCVRVCVWSRRPHRAWCVMRDAWQVIGHFVASLCKFHNATYGTSHTPDDYISYEFLHVWGCSGEEVRAEACSRGVQPWVRQVWQGV